MVEALKPKKYKLQQKYLRLQISLAKEAGKPIIIHDRDSHQDVVDILQEEHAGINGGILHCFSGSWEMAKQCLKMGFFISFAGPLTYKNARVPVEVAGKVPLDMVLVETDSPYLTPHPFRGKTNEPARVIYTAEKLAQIRGMDYEEIAEITGLTPKAVEYHITKSLRALRVSLKDYLPILILLLVVK